MELRHLRYFVMTAEEGNVSRAAARLNISQPAVSRQIRDLEEEFGVTLFDRRHDGLSLTEAGRVGLAHAQEILRQSSALSEAMRILSTHLRRTSLRVGFIPTALPGFLTEGLRQFNETHRDVCVQIFEMTPHEQEQALHDDEIDLALLGSACPNLRRKYHVEPIRKLQMLIALPDDHPLSFRKSLDLAELSKDTFISLHEKHFPGRPELMETLFERAGFSAKIALKVDSVAALLGQVGGGAGVALVPSDADALPHARVVFVKLKRPQLTFVSSAVWKKTSESPVIKEFVRALENADSQA